MNDRLCHDCAWALATACVEPVAHMLRPEHQKDFHEIIYEHAKRMLLYYDTHAERERRRLTPSRN
jgi:hypothetical protein